MVTFAYPWLLWGLLALAGPLLLHLLNRRRPQMLVFPSIRFLTRAQLPREGRRRLRDLLLLLLRMMTFAAAILVMARPSWTAKPAASTSESRPRAVLVLDGSASMHGHGAAEKARTLALAEVDALSGWDVGVIVTDSAVASSLAPGASSAAVRATIADYAPSCLAGNPQEGLRQALAWLNASDSQGRLVVISDLQRGDWASPSAMATPGLEVAVRDAGQEGAANVGISSVRGMPLPNGGHRVLVVVRNYSAVSQERLLTVTAGNRQQRQTVTLAPLRQQRVVLLLAESGEPGGEASQGIASLERDGYPLDDDYHFWLGDLPAPRALLVMPGETDPASEEPAFFVRNALVAEDGGVPGFTVETITADLFQEVHLAATQAIFLLGATESLAPADIDELRQFVESGGVVFATPGAAPNQALRALRQAGLFEAQGQGLTGSSRDVSLGIGWVDPDCPLAGLYGNPQESDLFMFSIRRMLRLNVEPSVQTLIKTLDGLPFLAEKTVGTGRFYYFSLDFSLGWSDFPLTTSFLPTLRELCLIAVPPGYGVKRLVCGDAPSVAGEWFGQDLSAAPATGWPLPGLYRVGTWPVEVNVSNRESMTDRVNADDLRRSLSRVDAGRGEAASPAVAGGIGSGDRPWWKICAWCFALLLLSEATARLWIGNRG
ncbi:MAG: VWA domain-containing protein [Lentisphaerae bacterium]|nr:VWA domain-containing protein [Lentisphaerota bacterium]